MTSSNHGGGGGSSSGSNSGRKPPNFIECSVCGKEFGSRSLGIHEPQCLQKLRRTEIANNSSEQGNNGRGMRRKKKSSKEKQDQQQQQKQSQVYSEQYYNAFDYRQLHQHRSEGKLRNTPPPVSYFVEGEEGGEDDSRGRRQSNSKGVVVETSKFVLPRIQPNSLINYKALGDQSSSRGHTTRRPRTATLPRPKILNLDFIQYDMSLTRLDFSTTNLANLAASSSSTSSPSPVDPTFILSRMDDNQNSISGNGGVSSFALPAVTSAPSSTKNNSSSGASPYHPNQSKLSKNSDVVGASGATKFPPTKEDNMLGDPLQKWNLTDNEKAGSPLRQSEPSQFTRDSSSIITSSSQKNESLSFSDPVQSIRVNEAVVGEASSAAVRHANIPEIMNRSPHTPSSEPHEHLHHHDPIFGSIDEQFMTSKSRESSPKAAKTVAHSSRRSRCLSPEQTKTEEEQQGKAVKFQTSTSSRSRSRSQSKTFDFVYNSKEGTIGFVEARAVNAGEEVIVLKPFQKLGKEDEDDSVEVSPRGSTVKVPALVSYTDQQETYRLPELLPNPLMINQNLLSATAGEGISFPSKLEVPDDKEAEEVEVSDVITSEADDEFHSMLSTEDEEDTDFGEDLLETGEAEEEIVVDSNLVDPNRPSSNEAIETVELITAPEEKSVEVGGCQDHADEQEDINDNEDKVIEACERSSSASSSAASQSSVLDTFRNFVGNMFFSKSNGNVPEASAAADETVVDDETPVKRTESIKEKFEGNRLMQLLETNPSGREEKEEVIETESEIAEESDVDAVSEEIVLIGDDINGNEEEMPSKEKVTFAAEDLKLGPEIPVIEAHGNPSELSNLTGAHENPAAILGSGSESDDEADISHDDFVLLQDEADQRKLYFPAHEVTSSRTLIRRKLYKKRKDRGQHLINKERNNNLIGAPTKANGKEEMKNERSVSVKKPTPIIATTTTRPKSATDSTSVKSKAQRLSVAFTKVLKETKDGGDILASSSQSQQQRKKKSSTSSNRYMSPYQAQAVVVDHLLNALVRLQGIHKGENRKGTQKSTRKERPHTVHADEFSSSSGSHQQKLSTSTTSTTNPSTPRNHGRTPWTASHRTSGVEKKTVVQAASNRPWTSPQSASVDESSQSQSQSQSRPQTPKRSSSPFRKKLGSSKKAAANHSCLGCKSSHSAKTGIRIETIERLAVPKVLAEIRTCCVEIPPTLHKKQVEGRPTTPIESKLRNVTSSSHPPSRTSVASGKDYLLDNRRQKISATATPIPASSQQTINSSEGRHKMTKVMLDSDGKEHSSVQVLVKRNLSMVPSTEVQLGKRLTGSGGISNLGFMAPCGILKRPETAQKSQGTQTKRKGKKRGILKNSSGEGATVTTSASKSVSIYLQPSKSNPTEVSVVGVGDEEGRRSRSHSTKSVRILHPVDYRQCQSEESCCSEVEAAVHVLKSPKQIFKRELEELESISDKGLGEGKLFTRISRKTPSSSKRFGEVDVCYDQDEERTSSNNNNDASPLASVDIEGMKGITNVTMLLPKQANNIGGSCVDLNIVVRRRNEEGDYPEMKDLESTITPNKIYLIMDEPSERGSSRDRLNKTKDDGSLPQFLRGMNPPPPTIDNGNGSNFCVFYGGRLRLNSNVGEDVRNKQ